MPSMKLSKKAEYALRALVAMGRQPQGCTFSILEISTSESIPLKFLEQILLALKNGGILRSKRGVGGGYQLARPATHLSLADVVEIIDGPIQLMSCSAPAGKLTSCECGIIGGCGLGRSFAKVRDQLRDWLKKTTIASIVEQDNAPSGISFEI